MDCSLPGSPVCGIFPGKNTGVGCNYVNGTLELHSLQPVQPHWTPWVARNELEEHVNTSQSAQKYKREGMDFCDYPG